MAPSEWNTFRSKMKGKGYSLSELSDMYKSTKSKSKSVKSTKSKSTKSKSVKSKKSKSTKSKPPTYRRKKAYIIQYKLGGPDAFFWSKEKASSHIDPRNREIAKIHEVPMNKIHILKNTKKKYLYYIIDEDTPIAVFPSKAKLEAYAKEHGIKLGGDTYIRGLSNN